MAQSDSVEIKKIIETLARYDERFRALEYRYDTNHQNLKDEMFKQDARTENIFNEYVDNTKELEKESNIFRVELEKRIGVVEKELAIIEAVKLDKTEIQRTNLGVYIAIIGWIVTTILLAIRIIY